MSVPLLAFLSPAAAHLSHSLPLLGEAASIPHAHLPPSSFLLLASSATDLIETCQAPSGDYPGAVLVGRPKGGLQGRPSHAHAASLPPPLPVGRRERRITPPSLLRAHISHAFMKTVF
ncbi:hypothetical protein ASPZODRAFT_14577 [Penicilliopsis zonata CBS 506.65]|uniref:Uncharacterized protein n=1 Tax=Penicilliopsis zonata CBS 506.65 TaxID=1073090 RepID=A0A1L9SMK6_9EURO|nr:hypothetical protein ASPZODRAFT_14577 [Penicilliopsis zonata CBS 506.65]OJJ48440.1 hypothetical protein ASPZODRAFT_14577 [Penicilliopsis zonata CBS 506.65]